MDTKLETLTQKEGAFSVTFDMYPKDDVLSDRIRTTFKKKILPLCTPGMEVIISSKRR
jgi:hypothetical protein